jgi:hypothetical protein
MFYAVWRLAAPRPSGAIGVRNVTMSETDEE